MKVNGAGNLYLTYGSHVVIIIIREGNRGRIVGCLASEPTAMVSFVRVDTLPCPELLLIQLSC